MSFFTTIAYFAPLAMLGSCLMQPPLQLPADSYSCPSSVEGQNNALLLQYLQNISTTIARLMKVPQCGDGLWYRVAYLNMSDSTQQCPPNWREISTRFRACARPIDVNCSGEYFSTGSLQYSKVCGRAIGYQVGTADGFGYRRSSITYTIDDPYVDGVSVTHGTPRSHIWTFAAGNSEGTVVNLTTNCPCANPAANTAPPPNFVGDNYFCESGNPRETAVSGIPFAGDPLWDGEQCEGECCSNGKSPPWFSVTLPNPTSDDIEVRICGDEGISNEDTPIQLVEIYIQ